jgi:hypothetical protein
MCQYAEMLHYIRSGGFTAIAYFGLKIKETKIVKAMNTRPIANVWANREGEHE